MRHVKSYTIFVVDHEQQHLEQFRQVFAEWPHLVYYCTSIAEAKAILQGVLADIMICNLHLPDFAETDFLRYVQAKCPHAIRMVFGGETERVVLMKLVADGKAHRYFSIPWEKNGIADALVNDLLIRSRVRVRKCWRFLQGGKGVPPLPDVVRELERVLADPDYDLDDVVRVLAKDPVVSARLLKVVNSAAFAKVREINDLHHAVTYLGVSATRKIILFICATKYFHYPRRYHRLAFKIINHSLQCGNLAGMVAEDILPGQERVAATAGLLHDIGKLVLLSFLGESRYAAIDLPSSFYFNDNDFEEQTFGVCHQELGSSLMLWWNLPFVMVEAAANHCLPPVGLSGVARCVAIADRCLQLAETGGEADPELDALKPQMPVDAWLSQARLLVTPSLLVT